MWEHQVADFTGAGFRFIAYDRRSEGAAVEDLEALAQHLALERVHLVGPRRRDRRGRLCA